MARFSDLINVHLKETEAIIAQSALLLQKKVYGQSGELKTAGNIIENYVRNFIKSVSPDAIKVTSGYVVNPETLKSEINLAQHDIILANKATPPLFSIINDQIEIIPVESMVGIIEVKRTLTTESLKSAHDHIVQTYNNVVKQYRKKDEENNALSITMKLGTRAPLFGIIGLSSELTKEDIKSIVDPNIIDFVWAFNHNEAFVVGGDNGQVTSTISRKEVNSPRMLSIKESNAIVFSKVKGILSLWISSLGSLFIKAENINGYYFDVWDIAE